MVVRHRSFRRCCRVVLLSIDVQVPFSAKDFRAIAVHRSELHGMHRPGHGLLGQKLRWMRGRIGEVPAPASRFESFTLPLFAPAALNGNPALRGPRPVPQRVERHE